MAYGEGKRIPSPNGIMTSSPLSTFSGAHSTTEKPGRACGFFPFFILIYEVFHPSSRPKLLIYSIRFLCSASLCKMCFFSLSSFFSSFSSHLGLVKSSSCLSYRLTYSRAPAQTSKAKLLPSFSCSTRQRAN